MKQVNKSQAHPALGCAFLLVMLGAIPVAGYVHECPDAWPNSVMIWLGETLPPFAILAESATFRVTLAFALAAVVLGILGFLAGDAINRANRRQIAQRNAREARLIEEARREQEEKEQAKRGTPDLVQRFSQKKPWDFPAWMHSDWCYYGMMGTCIVGIIGIILWFVFVAGRA